MQHLRAQLSDLVGKKFHSRIVLTADDFEYKDPVDGSISSKQGWFKDV